MRLLIASAALVLVAATVPAGQTDLGAARLLHRQVRAEAESFQSRDKAVTEALAAQVGKLQGSKAVVFFHLANDLPYKLKRFPKSRQWRSNRTGELDRFPGEPSKGKILAPEFRTKVSLLRISVDGACVVHVVQGFRGKKDDIEKYMTDFTDAGWIPCMKSWTDDSESLDHFFVVARVVKDSVLTLEPQGDWRELPAVICSPVQRGSIRVRPIPNPTRDE